MSSIEDLKSELSKQQRSNRILSAEIENLKKGMSDNSSAVLMKKIEGLESELLKKDKEITDLKSVSSISESGVSGSGEGSIQDIKTKMIILQSKIRKSAEEAEAMKREIEDLQIQNKRLKRQVEEGANSEQLSKEVNDLKNQLSRYKAQASEQSQSDERSRALEAEVSSLRQQLAQRSSSNEMSEFQGGGNDKLIQKLKQMVEERDRTISQLQDQSNSGAAGGAGGTFLSQNRIQRRIAELEAQVNMLKKNESEMKRRYEEAMRKLTAKEEFSDF
jgi:chromosome segregation ATPase